MRDTNGNQPEWKTPSRGKTRRPKVSPRRELAVVTVSMVAAIAGFGGLLGAAPAQTNQPAPSPKVALVSNSAQDTVAPSQVKPPTRAAPQAQPQTKPQVQTQTQSQAERKAQHQAQRRAERQVGSVVRKAPVFSSASASPAAPLPPVQTQGS